MFILEGARSIVRISTEEDRHKGNLFSEEENHSLGRDEPEGKGLETVTAGLISMSESVVGLIAGSAPTVADMMADISKEGLKKLRLAMPGKSEEESVNVGIPFDLASPAAEAVEREPALDHHQAIEDEDEEEMGPSHRLTLEFRRETGEVNEVERDAEEKELDRVLGLTSDVQDDAEAKTDAQPEAAEEALKDSSLSSSSEPSLVFGPPSDASFLTSTRSRTAQTAENASLLSDADNQNVDDVVSQGVALIDGWTSLDLPCSAVDVMGAQAGRIFAASSEGDAYLGDLEEGKVIWRKLRIRCRRLRASPCGRIVWRDAGESKTLNSRFISISGTL